MCWRRWRTQVRCRARKPSLRSRSDMSALRLKLDENLHTDLVGVLREAGHDVEHAETD